MRGFLNNIQAQAQNVQTNLNNQAQNFQKELDAQKQGFQSKMQTANDNVGKKFDETTEKLDNALKKVNDGIKKFLPPTEEDIFRNELLLLSTNSDFQEYFAQSVSKRLASEFYMKLSNVGKFSNEISVLLKKSDFKEIQEDNEDISDFFIDLKPDVATTILCTKIDDKYNLLKEDKIKKFLNDAMVVYAEVIRSDFQKLAEIITECKKIEKKRLKKKDAKFLIDEITDLFENPYMSGGLLIKGQQIDKNNKDDLIDGNIIKYIKDNVFYTVKKDTTTNKIILNNCGSGVDLNDETKINEILDSKKCIFVADQEDPNNSCKQMQAQANAKDMDDYFYNQTLLKILLKNKAVFSKCLRTKLSPVFNKVLEKLYGFKGEEMKTINLTYSDKSYPIRTDIEKIIEKMVCDIGIIKITDLEPFMNIVEPLNKNNINLLKNLLKKVKDKKQKEKDPIKIAKIDADILEIDAKVGELENNIKSEATKKKEIEKAEATKKKEIEKAEAMKKKEEEKAEATKKAEADRLKKEEEIKEDAKYEQITESATYSENGIDYYVKNNGKYEKKGKAKNVVKKSFPTKLVFENIGNYFVTVSENCYVIKEELKEDQVKKAEEDAKKKAEQEAKQKAEQEAKQKAEQEAKQKAEQEAKQKAKQKAEQQKAEQEAKQKAEQQKAEQEAKQKAEQQKAEQQKAEQQKAEQEAKQKAEQEAKQKAEQEAKAQQKPVQKPVQEAVQENLNFDNVPKGCDKFQNRYNEYISSIEKLSRFAISTTNAHKRIFGTYAEITLNLLFQIQDASLLGDKDSSRPGACLKFPEWYANNKQWFVGQYNKIKQIINTFNTNNNNNKYIIGNIYDRLIQKGGKTKKKIYNNKRIFTRKSSSRVSRKTRRHKRTSR